MQLIFIRHAEPESGASYAEDELRPLSPEGRKTQEDVAKALRDLGVHPDVILSSPRIRAEQTAWITSEIMHTGDVIEVAELDGGFPLEQLLDRLDAYLDCNTILCVGHEPDMTRWTNMLLDESEEPVVNFGKSSVVALEFNGKPEAGKGKKRFFYSADELIDRL